MRLRQLQDFLQIAESGSISAAARVLGSSQPAVTKSIRTLEAQLAVPLVTRTARGILLTDYGRALLVRARAAVSEVKKAEAELLMMSGARTGTVAMGFGPLAAILLVPEASLRFIHRYPDVELRLTEGLAHVTLPLVRNEMLDMTVAPQLPGARTDKSVKFRPLFHNLQVVVGRRGHPATGAASARALTGYRWLSLEPLAIADQMLATLGVPAPRRIVLCESFNVLVRLLAESDMLALVSRRVLRMPMVGASLAEIAIGERPPALTTGLYTRADAPLTPPAAALAKVLIELGRELAVSA